MSSYFTSDFFASNRSALQKRLGTTVPIIITGNGLMQRGADEPFRFHQESNFWYLTGLNGPDLTLVITQKQTYLIVPTLSAERAAFDGAHDIAVYAARSGIDTILSVNEGWQKLKQDITHAKTVATLAAPPSHIKRHDLYTLPFRRRLIAKLKRLHPALEIQDIRMELASMRCTKQPVELRALQQAIDITSATLLDVASAKALANVHHEYQLEAAIGYGFRSRGAEGHAFSPIVGAGAHGTTLHYLENSGPLANNELIVLDVGASVEHYSADVTRTVSQQPITDRQAEVFRAVCAVQDFALSQLKPGTLLNIYEKDIETYMGEQLQQLGLINKPTHTAIRQYFPHGTSHFLGLDTHDVGNYQQPLAENMVITCEPGIYIPEEGIGVRIEDDVLITKTGYKVLSSACPRELTPVQ